MGKVKKKRVGWGDEGTHLAIQGKKRSKMVLRSRLEFKNT